MPRVRQAGDADVAAVYAINEANVPHVNSISQERFQGFIAEAVYFRVALLGTDLAGYLVAFAPGAPYDSLNFLWFQQRYEKFIYIDRIAVAAGARRRGVASVLYRDFFRFAGPRTGLVTCEVNTRPVNAESMAFHKTFGFREVGTQETDGGAKTVSLMAVEPNTRIDAT
jgi:predicted GNAT superfamily acetyltransferase